MPQSEQKPGPDTVGETKRLRRGHWIVLGVAAIAGAIGFLVATALSDSTSCATGRSPVTFALLIGFTAALAAASGLPHRR